MQPAFHRRRIVGLTSLMVEEAEAMLERWADSPCGRGEPFDALIGIDSYDELCLWGRILGCEIMAALDPRAERPLSRLFWLNPPEGFEEHEP